MEAIIEDAAKAIGVTALKPGQKKAVLTFIRGYDVFVSLTTGYGKSVCSALLPLLFDRLREDPGSSIALCISPLTALMMEQRTKVSDSSYTTSANFLS